MLAACARRNAVQVCWSRLGAGSIPASLRIVQTVLAASLLPSPTSSPWIGEIPSSGLLREPDDEFADLDRLRRASGTPMRIRPAPHDQLTVPAQKRRRRHEG